MYCAERSIWRKKLCGRCLQVTLREGSFEDASGAGEVWYRWASAAASERSGLRQGNSELFAAPDGTAYAEVRTVYKGSI